MLRKETVDARILELLNILMQDERLKNFILVGGTALALQIGHRKSIDIDLFSEQSFNENELLEYLENSKRFKLDFISKNTIKGEIQGVKVDLITHSYPLVKPSIMLESIRMAGLEDITAMKLNAIIGNGTRLKDFVDIAYCSSHVSLNQMLAGFEQKYEARNPVMAMKALSYFKDVNLKEPVHLQNGKLTWRFIEKRLTKMIESPLHVFPPLSMQVKQASRRRPKP